MREAWISDEVDGITLSAFSRRRQELDDVSSAVESDIGRAFRRFGIFEHRQFDRDVAEFVIPKEPGMVSPPMDAVDLVNAIVAGDAEQALAIARRVIA